MSKNKYGALLAIVAVLLASPFAFVEASPGGHMGLLDGLGILFLLFLFIIAVLFFGGHGDVVESIMQRLLEKLNSLSNKNEDKDKEKNSIEITYPAGKSSTIFQTGWVFGAKCIAEGVDVSEKVHWSGSGTFSPEVGMRSRPSFSGEGQNTVTVSYKDGKTSLSKTITVNAISTAGYAKMGDLAKCPADSHGCPACPHVTVGPIISGSPLILIDGKPAARQGDAGVHAACCDGNHYKISGATGEVIIGGRRAAKIGDATTHCGGSGNIIPSE